IAAEDLDRVRRDLHGHIAADAFGHAGKQVEAFPVTRIASTRAFVDQRARRLDLHGHVGEHELHALEFRNWPLELPAFLGIGDTGVERALCKADGLSPNGRTVEVKCPHRCTKAFAFLTNEILDRHAYVVEEDRRVRRAAKAHLAFVASEGDARHFLWFDDESADALRA